MTEGNSTDTPADRAPEGREDRPPERVDESDSSGATGDRADGDRATENDADGTEEPQGDHSPVETGGSIDEADVVANGDPTSGSDGDAVTSDLDDGEGRTATGTGLSAGDSDAGHGVDGFSGDVDLEDLDLDTESDEETDEASRGLFDEIGRAHV